MSDRVRKALENGLFLWVMHAENWRTSDTYGCGQPEWHPNQQAVIDEYCDLLGRKRITAQGPWHEGAA